MYNNLKLPELISMTHFLNNALSQRTSSKNMYIINSNQYAIESVAYVMVVIAFICESITCTLFTIMLKIQ